MTAPLHSFIMVNMKPIQNIDILKRAEIFCSKHKQRLTKPRFEVLKIIAASARPVGAYKILEELGKVLVNPKPPTAYRAIEFWQQNGFIHRVASLNAYVICHAGHQHQGGQFMICDSCGFVVEAHLCEIPELLRTKAEQNMFAPGGWNFEIHGLCMECQSP